MYPGRCTQGGIEEYCIGRYIPWLVYRNSSLVYIRGCTSLHHSARCRPCSPCITLPVVVPVLPASLCPLLPLDSLMLPVMTSQLIKVAVMTSRLINVDAVFGLLGQPGEKGGQSLVKKDWKVSTKGLPFVTFRHFVILSLSSLSGSPMETAIKLIFWTESDGKAESQETARK